MVSQAARVGAMTMMRPLGGVAWRMHRDRAGDDDRVTDACPNEQWSG